jgi:steroid delta-isomerase-like uncharacterized protein
MEFPKILFGVILMAVMGSAAVALSFMNQQQALAQQNQTSEEQNKKLILDISKLNLSIEEEMGHLLANDTVIHSDKPFDRQQLRNQSKEFFTAFPDMKAEPEVIVAEDDLLGVLWTFNGTHQGEFLGIPASGKPVTLRIAEFMRISNGTITEYWPVPDATDLYLDIGYLVHRNETNTITTTQ